MSRHRWIMFTMALLLVAASLQLFGCGPRETAEEPRDDVDPRYGGEFIVGTYGDATYYMPPFTGDGYTYHTKYLIFDSLVRLDENLVPQPLLAHTWDVSEDYLTYTFYIRDDVVWHDGHPLSARDIYFTYQVIADPLSFSAKRPYLATLVGFAEFEGAVRGLDGKLKAEEITDAQHTEQATALYEEWRQLDAIEIVDEYTIRFNLERPLASFMTISTEVGIVPEHILAHVDDITHNDYMHHPIGTGPFKFVEWVRGDYWILDANEDYFLGRPFLDRVIFRVIPDATTRIAELLAGRIHYAYTVPFAELDYLERAPGVKVLSGPGLGWDMFNFQLEKHFFDDPKVRQAIAHALDKDTMVEELFEGRRPVAHGPFNPAFGWAHKPDVLIHDYDPARSIQLLEEAGFVRQSDGWYKGGKSLDFTMRVGMAAESVEVVEVFQSYLKEVGINVTIEPLEPAAWLRAIFDADFDMMYFGWTGLADPDGYIYTVHHSSAIGGRNVMKYRNNRVDELFDLAKVTTDLDLRAEYYYETQDILAQELPVIYLSYYVNYHGVSDRLEGWVPNPAKHPAIFFSLKDVYFRTE